MTVVTFVLLAVHHNLWRPVLFSRVASHADPTQTATILSIDSQASSLFLAVVAPLLGWSTSGIASRPMMRERELTYVDEDTFWSEFRSPQRLQGLQRTRRRCAYVAGFARHTALATVSTRALRPRSTVSYRFRGTA